MTTLVISFKKGIIYDNNVNVSGGTKNGSFYLSGSNFRQTGIVPGTAMKKQRSVLMANRNMDV